jgi:hypothetical protein
MKEKSILDTYACEKRTALWLSNHMQLPEQVSSLVMDFGFVKPIHFLFEEDDL